MPEDEDNKRMPAEIPTTIDVKKLLAEMDDMLVFRAHELLKLGGRWVDDGDGGQKFQPLSAADVTAMSKLLKEKAPNKNRLESDDPLAIEIARESGNRHGKPVGDPDEEAIERLERHYGHST